MDHKNDKAPENRSFMSFTARQMNEMGGAYGMYGGQGKCAYSVLVGKPEGRPPLGIPKRRREIKLK